MRSAFLVWLVPAGFLILGSCATNPATLGFQPSIVIERIADKNETPKWAHGESVMAEENGEITFSNVVSMSGDARPEACTKAASLDAKAEMLKHIKENITASGQLADDSVQSDPAFESLTAFLSQGELNGAKIGDKYWEKREESAADGSRVLRLSCAAKVSISKAMLSKMLREATTKEKSGNPEIRAKLLDVQKSFIEGIGRSSN